MRRCASAACAAMRIWSGVRSCAKLGSRSASISRPAVGSMAMAQARWSVGAAHSLANAIASSRRMGAVAAIGVRRDRATSGRRRGGGRTRPGIRWPARPGTHRACDRRHGWNAVWRKSGAPRLFRFEPRRWVRTRRRADRFDLSSVTSLVPQGFRVRGPIHARAFQMYRQVLFCSAACKPNNASFTISPHPDVGEGASPQPVHPGAGFFIAHVFYRSRRPPASTWREQKGAAAPRPRRAQCAPHRTHFRHSLRAVAPAAQAGPHRHAIIRACTIPLPAPPPLPTSPP
ncbi:hypothetical protein ABIE09_002951 [Lysobacter enzymogenes]